MDPGDPTPELVERLRAGDLRRWLEVEPAHARRPLKAAAGRSGEPPWRRMVLNCPRSGARIFRIGALGGWGEALLATLPTRRAGEA